MKQKKTKKLSLKVILSIAFLIFTVVLLSTLWLLQTVFLDSTYKLIKTQQIKNCGNSIATNITNDNINSLVKTIQEQNDMAVSVYDVSSNIIEEIITNEPSTTGIRSYLNFSDIYKYYNQAKNNGGSIMITTENGKLGEFIPEKPMIPYNQKNFEEPNEIFDRKAIENEAYILIKNTGSKEYLIVVESEITPVTSVVDTLRIELIIVTIIMIILSVIVAIITGTTIARPISKTNKKAKELANQNYNITFDKSNYKEISELNSTLNYAAKELSKTDTLRRELIANVSHDLRTPLTMITGYAEIMRDLPGENNKENLQVIIEESNRLSALVTDLLDLSKLEAKSEPLNKSKFSITDCINSILNRYKTLCEQEKIDIAFNYDCNAFIFADELKITQVIYNLINNAINYIGEDKKIIIIQSVTNEKVKIEIIDHGEGIEQENLKHIWDRYYKVDKNHKRAKIGTGLGLSIVKNILIEHDAEFNVNSEKGKGSNFFFSLPIIK